MIVEIAKFSKSLKMESRSHFKVWSELELKEFPDKLVLKSLESGDEIQGFSVCPFQGNIQNLNGDEDFGEPIKVSTVYGVSGTIRLLSGTHVLVITSRREVGAYLGFPVFEATSMKFISSNDTTRRLSSQEKRDEDYFMTLLRTVESTPGLYYSYETDITVNLQRRFALSEGWISKPIWKQADPRYVWNRNILEELIENKLDGFIIPLLQGSFKIGHLNLRSTPATILLISRRCTRRLGTRMWRRGANLEGDVANFVETEQVLEINGMRSSFLQVRGSIPLLWEQIVDLSYKPRLNVVSHEQTPKVVDKHFRDLLQRYGDVVAVDLTDKHGNEGLLSSAYAAEMQKLPTVRYVSFDFHQTCGNSNFDNIKLLYDQLSKDFENHGYFLIDAEGQILAEQKGIIRSNCIDCLDRTNVTQSYLAKKILNCQLQRVGALSSDESISMFTEDTETLNTLWAEQGDEISLEYSGTHALKGDLVRYGQQSIAGVIKDGMSALTRYYLNNFQDGLRQDAIDLISGHYIINGNNASPLNAKRFDSISYLPAASALLIGGLTVTTISMNQATRRNTNFMPSAVCASVAAGIMTLIKTNGRQLVSKPRLCGLI